MTLHDPDSKHALTKDANALDNSQLIDDEEYEDEDDLEPMPEDASVSIMTDQGTILDSGTATMADGTIAITIDPQTQQLINSGNDQVMFVVQYPNDGSEEAAVTNGQPTVVAVATPSTSTPRIISRGGRVTRSAAKANGKYFIFYSHKLVLNLPTLIILLRCSSTF